MLVNIRTLERIAFATLVIIKNDLKCSWKKLRLIFLSYTKGTVKV